MIRLFELFKKKERPGYYIFHSNRLSSSIKKLALACEEHHEYSLVFSSVYFDSKKLCFVVHIECVQKEAVQGEKPYFAIRRDEKIIGQDLEKLLNFSIEYLASPTAFIEIPVLPDGIHMHAKEFKRSLRNNPAQWKKH